MSKGETYLLLLLSALLFIHNVFHVTYAIYPIIFFTLLQSVALYVVLSSVYIGILDIDHSSKLTLDTLLYSIINFIMVITLVLHYPVIGYLCLPSSIIALFTNTIIFIIQRNNDNVKESETDE